MGFMKKVYIFFKQILTLLVRNFTDLYVPSLLDVNLTLAVLHLSWIPSV